MQFFSNIYNNSWESNLLEDARKKGSQEGKNGRPSPDLMVPDENENKYHSKAVALIIKANNELTRQIRNISPKATEQKNKLSEITTEKDHRASIDTLEAEIISSRDQHRQELHQANLKLIRAEGHLNSFKTLNQVKHEPDHPKDTMHYMSVVFLILIAESILNAYFWRNNDMGLIGGIAMAFMLAFANISLSIVFAIGFTHKNIESQKDKLISLLSVIIGVTVIIALNIFITVKRNAIASLSIDQSSVSIIFQETESIILFFLGLFFASIAAHKGYRVLGSIPGFKKVQDDYDLAFNNIKNQEIQIKNSLRLTCDSALEKLKQIKSDLSTSKQKISALIGEVNVIEKDYNAFSKQVQLSLNQIIKKYRSTNSASRPQGIEVPRYFDENMELNILNTEELDSLKNECQDLGHEVENISLSLLDLIKQESVKINEIKSEALGSSLTEYFKQMVDNARKEYISLIAK